MSHRNSLIQNSLINEIHHLYTTWDRYGLTPALQTEWLRVWQIYTAPELIHTVSVDQIGSLALLGNEIAMANRNYIASVEVWQPYFQHLHLQTADKEDLLFYRCLRSASFLRTGEIARALEEYRLALSLTLGKEHAVMAMRILEGIRSYCLDQPLSAVAEQELTDFVKELKSHAPDLVRQPAENYSYTYEDLAKETVWLGD